MVKTEKLEKCVHRWRIEKNLSESQLYQIKCRDCAGYDNRCILYDNHYTFGDSILKIFKGR
jgi:hypothetical protein